jgi:Zn-finger nucleic acid-binding protein
MMEDAMQCPRCTCEMRKVRVRDIELDTCDACEGVWFDSDELRQVLDMNKDELYSSEIAHTMEATVEHEETPGRSEMPCPRCGKELARYCYQGYSGIVLDGCDEACGIWLDDGELKKLFDYMCEANRPDPEKEMMVMRELKRIKAESDFKSQQLIDSLVMMDNRPGLMKIPGMVLQGIYKMLDRIGI